MNQQSDEQIKYAIEKDEPALALFLYNRRLASQNSSSSIVPPWLALKLARFLMRSYQLDEALSIARAYLSMDSDCPGFTGEIINELRICQSQSTYLGDRISSFVESYCSIANTTWQPLSYKIFFDTLEACLAANKPFSYIRLGDGEGNALAYSADCSNEGLSEWSSKIHDLQFGANIINSKCQIHIGNLMREACESADVIGIIKPNNLLGKIIDRSWSADRQIAGNLAVYDYIINSFDPKGSFPYTDSSVHKDKVWQEKLIDLISSLDFIGVIGPHPESLAAFSALGIHSLVYHQVPAEFKYFKPAARHFPEAFQLICKSINPPYQGALYLVGGGLLGKYYCNLIKQKGGCAIDVGSFMDEMAGHTHTRNNV